MTQHCGVFVGQVAVASSVILTTLALTLVALDVIPVLKTPNLVDGLSAIILALILGLAVLSRAGLWRLASIHAVMLFSTSFITDIWIDAVAAIFESPTFEVITLIITALGLFAASLFIDSRIAAPVDRFIGRLFPQYQREAS